MWKAATIALITCAAASAGLANPPDNPNYINRNWDKDEVTGRVIQLCNITPGFWSIDKEDDGRARVQISPSVPPDQANCAADQLTGSSITTTDQKPSGH